MGGHKGVIFCIKTCFRSVCRHPFLVGMVLSMIFLYKYFPFMFSLLVWSSPVFIATAVVLGTILSFGKPDIHVIDKKDKLSTENVFSRMGVQRDGNVVKKDENFDNVGGFSEIRRGVVEKSIGESSSTADNFSDAGRDDTLSRKNAVLAKEESREFQTDKQVSDVERMLPDMVIEKNDELTGQKEGKSESLGIQESHEKSLDQPQNKSSEKFDGNIPTGSHWKQEDEGEEDDDDDDDDDDRDISGSGSDRTVSISPGTSITHISPIDELHPLLDEDAHLTTHMSTELSDAISEISSNTVSESSYGLDSDMETHGDELEVTDLDEELYADNDDDAKSAVSWTDDDHKNVINLGSSDLERNQRLENLIATRSLRKSMKVMAERNLIDLDGTDRPHNVAHISTARRNPFNLSDDLNLNFPGSAPSIMARRRNPFELPYDPGEEKHDLMGDDYEHVVTLQPKDPPFLRRNETFSAGPSLLGTSRHDYILRPSSVLSRRSSDMSEYKAISEPETESLGSVEELENNIPVEEDDSREPVVTTMAEHPSEDVGHGSESSEDEDTFDKTEAEKEDATPDDIKVNLGDVDNSHEIVSGLSETAVADTHMEGDTSEANEVVTADDSSSTSLSEEHGNVFNEKEGEQLSHFKPTTESSDAESTSTQSVDGTHPKEPVYDSSPTARHSSSSIFSDHQVDILETNSLPVSVERTISATDTESGVSTQITEKDTPATEPDEKFISAHHQSPSKNNTSIQSDKEMPLSDQSVVERSPVKHEVLRNSVKYVNASEVQGLAEETEQNIKPTTSEPASTQSEVLETETTPDRPDLEDNIPCVGTSDAILVSEKPLLKKTGSEPAESEEGPSRNVGGRISDVPVESGTIKDKEPRLNEDEHTNDGSGGSEISPREGNTQHVGNSGTPLISEKPLEETGSGPADSEVQSRNAGEPISDMPVESGNVKDEEPRYEEDELTNEGSGEAEESLRKDNIPHIANSGTILISEKPLEETGSGPADSEEVPSQNAGEAISDMPVESGIVKDKEPRYEEDEHKDEGSGESEISTRELNIPNIGDSGTNLISEKPLLDKTGSEPPDSEEVPSQNAGDVISDMPGESGTAKDKEPHYEEDEHTDNGSGESEISPKSRPGLEAEVGLPAAEAQSHEDVKSASKQVDGVEFKNPPDLLLNETKDGYSEHELLHKNSVPDEIGSESSRSVQDGHSGEHHLVASEKREPPDLDIDDPKKTSQPKSWWSPFGST